MNMMAKNNKMEIFKSKELDKEQNWLKKLNANILEKTLKLFGVEKRYVFYTTRANIDSLLRNYSHVYFLQSAFNWSDTNEGFFFWRVVNYVYLTHMVGDVKFNITHTIYYGFEEVSNREYFMCIFTFGYENGRKIYDYLFHKALYYNLLNENTLPFHKTIIPMNEIEKKYKDEINQFKILVQKKIIKRNEDVKSYVSKIRLK